MQSNIQKHVRIALKNVNSKIIKSSLQNQNPEPVLNFYTLICVLTLRIKINYPNKMPMFYSQNKNPFQDSKITIYLKGF